MRSEMSWGNEHLAKAKSLYEQSRRNRDQHGGVAPRGGALAEEAELAFESFVRAVHACQSLELRGGTLPRGFSENSASGAAPGARSDKDVLPPDAHVMEDEQVSPWWRLGRAPAVLPCARSLQVVMVGFRGEMQAGHFPPGGGGYRFGGA